MNQITPLGLSGRIAAAFQSNALTPLLALVALLLGLFAVLVTPREEEPQINVTMANVLIPFPGASSTDVQNMVARPAEQVLGQIAGIEHTYSVARPGVAVLTVQFKVGVSHSEALVRLFDVLNANQDWLPRDLGTLTPIVKPKGIDDVPVAALTLWTRDADSAADLQTVAHSLEAEIKSVKGVREVQTLGGPGRSIQIQIDPARLRARGIDLLSLQKMVAAANVSMPAGTVAQTSGAGTTQMLTVEAGDFLRNADDVADIVVGVSNGKPVFLRDVAVVSAGAQQPRQYVTYTPGAADPAAQAGQTGQTYPAVTIQVTKKPGENAVEVTTAVRAHIDALKNTVIPANYEVTVTRDYGQTAAEKANKLIQKLAFATGSVILLVGLALGRREALIVGAAVILTLTATLFASWAWGFTLNRVSLFALIFSIGILVDDAIVVVENIHRHQQLTPEDSLKDIIPRAVDEVGGPTILATLTVIAALLPMAFVSGLMGPYMSPIPINSSLGMAISLAIAFTVTPWLALKFMREHGETHGTSHRNGTTDGTTDTHTAPPAKRGKVQRIFDKILMPLLSSARKRWVLLGGILAALAVSVGLTLVPGTFAGVVLKMLPFDNKSEFQVIVDMPAGTPLEDTAATLQDLGAFLARQPEVLNLQTYAGTASPITFNGLVRQYYLRADAEQGDLQVNLVDKHHRSDKSHVIAQRLRPELEKIGALHNARIKVVEVPPGPPVMSPLVAEVYGPDEAGRQRLSADMATAFAATPDIVGIDTSLREDAPRAFLRVRRQRAESLGIPVAAIAQTVSSALSGADASYLHDGQSKYPVPLRIQLPLERQVGLDALLALPMRAANGQLVPLSELVTVERGTIDKPLFTKDLKGVSYVFGDMAGQLDSPLYGLFAIRSTLGKSAKEGDAAVGEYWINQPTDTYRQYAIKWDGESQITYDTFRDMGAAYGVGLILIYLLVVAQFKSYLTPLVIMAPIPLTIIGVMPGHALLNAQFTATSMIGMIALAGIIVRNSILLVDFIELQVREGMAFKDAVLQSAAVRAQPIVLTGVAAMIGAFFILDDPIFNGLAVSLIFGILVSTLLTLVVIPVMYYALYRRRMEPRADAALSGT
jgi:multidrug efflux pump subunit AcrB